MLKKNIFISSTILDLKKERNFIKKFLENYKKIKIKCFLSEYPDFPVTPLSLANDVYQICIDNILNCDYMIQILNKRYGTPDISDKGENISITHKEYRVAFENRIPVFTLIKSNLWKVYTSFKDEKKQNYIAIDSLSLFSLIDEIQDTLRKKWMFIFDSTDNIKQILVNSLLNFDDSVFISDVTVPDGTTFLLGESFEKEWEIKNNGMIVWRNRFLKEINPGCGLVPEKSLVPIPETNPGEIVRIKIKFNTPKNDVGTYISYWKMVDKTGNYCFNWKRGIWCKVKVVDRATLK